MSSDATCTLTGLYPQATDLPAPSAGGSYAVFQVAGFSESGVQAFIRLVPSLGLAMAHSQIPLNRIEGVGQLAAALCDYVASGKLDASEVLGLVEALKNLL